MMPTIPREDKEVETHTLISFFHTSIDWPVFD